MKAIKFLLQNRKAGRNYKDNRGADDGKLIEKIFKEIVLNEIKGISPEDIREVSFKDKVIYVKTAHPAVASEIWQRREEIMKKANGILEKESIKKIKAQ